MCCWSYLQIVNTSKSRKNFRLDKWYFQRLFKNNLSYSISANSRILFWMSLVIWSCLISRIVKMSWAVYRFVSLCSFWFLSEPRFSTEGQNFKLTLCCFICRPLWSRGNVLASRSKVRGFQPDWGRWIFSGRKNPEHKSSRRDFKLGIPSLRFQAR